jgi:hypothetical protein
MMGAKLNDGEKILMRFAISKERERILALIKPHITVCNYEAVNGEECDVCVWAARTVEKIENS